MLSHDSANDAGSQGDADLDEEKPFKCKFCDRRFKACSALGGHVSKAHPGLSVAYEHKKRVRDTRHLERDLHQQAVQMYKKQLSECNGDLNRNTIKRIKKDLVKSDQKYQCLLNKFN